METLWQNPKHINAGATNIEKGQARATSNLELIAVFQTEDAAAPQTTLDLSSLHVLHEFFDLLKLRPPGKVHTVKKADARKFEKAFQPCAKYATQFKVAVLLR